MGGPPQEVWSEKGEDQVWAGLGVPHVSRSPAEPFHPTHSPGHKSRVAQSLTLLPLPLPHAPPSGCQGRTSASFLVPPASSPAPPLLAAWQRPVPTRPLAQAERPGGPGPGAACGRWQATGARPDASAAHLWMACPAGVCSTSSPACRRTSMTVLFPRK